MTFVPQPFEQFVDDLLTALTGGFVREEHRFEGHDEPYAISAPSAVTDSVRVVGRRAGAFRAFERGLDFEYNATDAAIEWIEGGTLPDDRSFFYVNYYPTEGDRRLTDRNKGSVTSTLAEAFSRQFAILHKQMELIYRSAFVEFSTDVSLEHVAALLDITRRDARFAIGEVLFKRSTPAPAAIAVPSGTIVSTLDGIAFETIQERRLRRGQLSVTVPIRARTPGTDGAVAAEAISVLNEPLLGIEAVLNAEAPHFEAARETDPELRRRIQGSLERAGRSTRNAILQTLIQEIPEVTENNVRIVERLDEPGLVELQFGLAQVDERTVRRIDDAIFRSRAAGVRVIHNLGSRGRTAPTAEIASSVPEGIEGGSVRAAVLPPQDALAGLPDGVMPLRFEVLYRLVDPNLSPPERDEIEDGIRERVSSYVEQLAMDADLIHSKLIGRVVEPDVVLDASVRAGVSGGPDLFEENLATEGRKAAIANIQADVFVGPMAESVIIDVAIAAEARPDWDPAAAMDQPKDTVGWQLTLKDALGAALSGRAIKPDRLVAAPDPAAPSPLEALDIAQVIRTALEDGQYRLVADGPITLNATFEDSGRVLSGPSTIDLAPYHHVVFRRVTLDVASALDG